MILQHQKGWGRKKPSTFAYKLDWQTWIGTPAACWLFIPSATTLYDIIGNNHGTLQNTEYTDWIPTRHGGFGLDLDGVNEHVTFTDSDVWNVSSLLFFYVRVKLRDVTNQQAVIGRWSDTSASIQWLVDAYNGNFRFILRTPSDTTTVRYSNTTIATGTWYDVAGVYDGNAGRLDLYLNGKKDNGSLSGSVPSTVKNVGIGSGYPRIGKKGDSTPYCNGTVDFALIAKTAPPDAYIAKIYQEPYRFIQSPFNLLNLKSGTLYLKSLSATAAGAVKIQRKVGKKIIASGGGTASLKKQTRKILRASAAGAAFPQKTRHRENGYLQWQRGAQAFGGD